MTPEMVAQGVVPNPLGIFDFLSGKGRSMLVQIPFEKAVRDYLTLITVKITSDGVMYNGLRFRSAELMQSGLPDYAKRNGSFEMKAFTLELCVSTLWLENRDGHLLEIKYVPPLMEDVDFIPLTHADSFVYDKALTQLNDQQKDVASAAALLFEQGCRDQENLASKKVKPLKVKAGVVSKLATREAMNVTGARSSR